LLSQYRFQFGECKRRGGVLQLPQLRCYLFGKQIGAQAEQLTEFDEGWTQLFEQEPQPSAER
jgi:hypothetical protein